MIAATSTEVAPLVHGPARPATVLGVAASALYLQVGADVLALVTCDAVRLPCAVTLARPSTDFSLRSVPPDGFVTVGDGGLSWASGGTRIEVEVVREWLPARVRPIRPRADRVAQLRAGITGIDIGVRTALPSPASLLGRGPGLTPSGDDVLAGFALASRALGHPVPSIAGLHRTTALSGALLRHAEAGACIPQVATLVDALGSDESLTVPLDALLTVGHTSGAALARGILLAADAFDRAAA